MKLSRLHSIKLEGEPHDERSVVVAHADVVERRKNASCSTLVLLLAYIVTIIRRLEVNKWRDLYILYHYYCRKDCSYQLGAELQILTALQKARRSAAAAF